MENRDQQLLNSTETAIMADEAASITSNRRDQHRIPSFRPTTSSWIHSESPENHLVKMGRYVFLNMMWILAVVLSCFGQSFGGQGMVHVVSCTVSNCVFPYVIGSFPILFPLWIVNDVNYVPIVSLYSAFLFFSLWNVWKH